MAHYQVTVDRELLQVLFVRDDGLARLVENIINGSGRLTRKNGRRR